ncbi:hypothetical protein WN55_02511 [Dufourea novaeangliae]|uniref:Uncharacterized protein n=1 Tax=Dufourea novaeangliae TaxID=178035 RepID=A0A154PIW6_DUFNO|nr:hypothetical protein WN55_02511 [Dufourea novaeangliae]
MGFATVANVLTKGVRSVDDDDDDYLLHPSSMDKVSGICTKDVVELVDDDDDVCHFHESIVSTVWFEASRIKIEVSMINTKGMIKPVEDDDDYLFHPTIVDRVWFEASRTGTTGVQPVEEDDIHGGIGLIELSRCVHAFCTF